MNKLVVIVLAFVLVISSAQYYSSNIYAQKGNHWENKGKYSHYGEDHETRPYYQSNYGYRPDSGYGHESKAKYKHYRYDYSEPEHHDYYYTHHPRPQPKPYQPAPSYGWSG